MYATDSRQYVAEHHLIPLFQGSKGDYRLTKIQTVQRQRQRLGHPTSGVKQHLTKRLIVIKKTIYAGERNRPDVQDRRQLWRYLQQQWKASRLVFIDESGINTKMTRLYGRSLSHQRCVDQAPHGHWHTNTFIAALRHDRIDAPMLIDGPMNSAIFLQYVQEVLAPTLSPGDLVICDNLSSHKSQAVRKALQKVGADIEYLPPYSPDLNPIKMAFAKIKAHIRSKAPRNLEQIIESIKQALDAFSQKTCTNLFKHAKYATA